MQEVSDFYIRLETTERHCDHVYSLVFLIYLLCVYTLPAVKDCLLLHQHWLSGGQAAGEYPT